MKGTESLQSHLGETEIPIDETELIRVSGYGYVRWTLWRWIDQIGGAEFDFRFRTYMEMRKWLKDFGAYHLAFWASKPLSNTSSLLDSIGFSYGLNVILDH